MWPGNYFYTFFKRGFPKKDSVEVSMLIWTNFDSFPMNLPNISILLNFPTEVVLNSLQHERVWN